MSDMEKLLNYIVDRYTLEGVLIFVVILVVCLILIFVSRYYKNEYNLLYDHIRKMESELSSTEKENNRLSKSNKALSDTFYELSSKIEMLEITIQSIDKNDVYLQVIRPLNQQISDLKKRLKDKEAMEAYLNSEISRLNYEKIDIAINGLYGLR